MDKSNQPTSDSFRIVTGRCKDHVSTGGETGVLCIPGRVDEYAHMSWVHRPAHKQTFVNKCLGTDGLRYCLCAQLLILFVYTCIFIYLHVAECSLNAACLSLSVSHECVTASHPCLTLMTEPVYLVMQPGPITKSTQVHVCVCVCLCKTWPRGIQPDMPLR